MGGLGAPLTAEQLEQLSTVDVLVLPISGGDTVDAEAAARTVRALEPAVVIPVRYPVSGAGDGEEGALQKFITGLSVDPERPGQRVSIQRRGLSETLRLVLLAPARLRSSTRTAPPATVSAATEPYGRNSNGFCVTPLRVSSKCRCGPVERPVRPLTPTI